MIDIILDLETTANGPKNNPEAQHKNNKVLLYGYILQSGNARSATQISTDGKVFYKTIEDILDRGEIPRLVGHNLKFDLKYLLRERPDIDWWQCEFFDTMYNEYRQSGHRFKYSNLEDSCARHKVAFTKGLDLGALIKGGTKMEDIPTSDLITYLKGDVEATTKLFYAQLAVTGYVEYSHDHVLPLAEMELLGLPFDRIQAQLDMRQLVLDQTVLEKKLFNWVEERLTWSDGVKLEETDLKYMAPRCVSYILTGEPIKGLTITKRRGIVWKKGWSPMLNKTQVAMVWGNKKPTNLGYPLGSKEIAMIEGLGNQAATPYVQALVKYRKLAKLGGTYYGPFLEETGPGHSTIHPKMNMCQTSTGRLSSSKPNGQNLPEVIRNLFHSEYGQFHEIDFKQLEVVALAFLSGDKQLLLDIQNGEDIHYNTGKVVFGWKTPADMTEKDRKSVKGVNFGLIYGGGAGGLAITTGLPKDLVAKLIKAFYGRYPGVEAWQKDFYTQMTSKLRPAGYVEGEQIYDALVQEPKSQRKFYFKEGPSPVWVRQKTGRKFSFKPTESKNYPVQGFAGGDIVMWALVYLYEALKKWKNTCIRMTVHDSILVDTHLSTHDLSVIMKRVCAKVALQCNLPFKLGFDITSGRTWQ